MTLYPRAIRDDRIREYLPVQRVLWERGAGGADILVDNQRLQTLLYTETPCWRPRKGDAVLVDYGIELHGGVRLVNNGPAARVRVRFGESASEAMGNPDQDHAIHDAELQVPAMGMLEYGNTAFRFVRVDLLEGEPAFAGLPAVALYRDLPWLGSFISSDDRLNEIWKTGAYTLLLNMQDYLYDGAKRDRLVWMGDLHPEIRGVLAVFGDVDPIRRSLDLVRDATPPSRPMNRIECYSLWWILCQHDYYQWSGNREYLAAQGGYLWTLLERFADFIDENGAETIPPFRFLDWPDHDRPAAIHAGMQGLMYWAMRYGADLCRALGLPPETADSAVRRLGAHHPGDDGSKGAAALLTVGGLEDRTLTLLDQPFTGIGPFSGYYALLAQPTWSALELIRRYWGAMLDYGATTFWEDFDLAWTENAGPISELPQLGKRDLHADFGAHCHLGVRTSLCHGWASGPTSFLSGRVLGVKFLEPGGSRIAVTPDLGGLEWVSGTLPTPGGVVRVEADASGRVGVEAPAGVEVVETVEPGKSGKGAGR